jgi:DTW domain-containing protein YfiP
VETRTRVLILQHPRERDVAIGTARMASLCLPNSELAIGADWSESARLKAALSDPERPAVLLYPGEGAIDVTANPPAGPVTLIVVDGTWRQARNLVKHNPAIAALPKYAFTPPAPSNYRIRKEPDEAYVSTIEALFYVLGALEGDPARFEALLVPFRAMVDTQIECEARARHLGSRHRKFRVHREPKLRLPGELTRDGDLVCLVAEANAWPVRRAEGVKPHPDELVQLAAYRPSTGERLDVVVRPRAPVAPRIPDYIGVPLDVLAAGESLDAALAKWRTFIRDTDVLCVWGTYALSLLREAEGFVPETSIDLRNVARVFHGSKAHVQKLGTLEDYVASFAAVEPEVRLAQGRAGTRLGHLVRVTDRFAEFAVRERS